MIMLFLADQSNSRTHSKGEKHDRGGCCCVFYM